MTDFTTLTPQQARKSVQIVCSHLSIEQLARTLRPDIPCLNYEPKNGDQKMSITEVLNQTEQDVEFARLRYVQLDSFQDDLLQINKLINWLRPVLARLDESTETGSAHARTAIKAELRKLGE